MLQHRISRKQWSERYGASIQNCDCVGYVNKDGCKRMVNDYRDIAMELYGWKRVAIVSMNRILLLDLNNSDEW